VLRHPTPGVGARELDLAVAVEQHHCDAGRRIVGNRGRGASAPAWPGAHPRAPDGRRRARRGRAQRMLDGPHRRPEALDRLLRAEAAAAGVDLRMRRPAPRRRATAPAVSAGPWRRSD
jgi:hypothetical protein